MGYWIVAVLSYLVGSSSMTFYLAKWNGVNMRAGGSGNLGASNAVLLMGWRAGVLVALHDIGKSALAVWLAGLIFPALPYVGAVAGVCSVLGHIFPFYLRFKGGKGFASYFGMTLGLNWKLALVIMVVVILVTLVTDYIVVGTVTTVLTVPAYFGVMENNLLLAAILGIATAVILWKHRENFVRLRRGTEIGLRSAAKGEHRVRK